MTTKPGLEPGFLAFPPLVRGIAQKGTYLETGAN
jgi:hypothetical protein